jgi:hypothetical protein
MTVNEIESAVPPVVAEPLELRSAIAICIRIIVAAVGPCRLTVFGSPSPDLLSGLFASRVTAIDIVTESPNEAERLRKFSGRKGSIKGNRFQLEIAFGKRGAPAEGRDRTEPQRLIVLTLPSAGDACHATAREEAGNSGVLLLCGFLSPSAIPMTAAIIEVMHQARGHEPVLGTSSVLLLAPTDFIHQIATAVDARGCCFSKLQKVQFERASFVWGDIDQRLVTSTLPATPIGGWTIHADTHSGVRRTEGWHEPEPWGVWSGASGHEGTFVLTPLEFPAVIRVELSGVGFARASERRRFQIFCGDSIVARFSAGRDHSVIPFELSSEVLRNSNYTLRIVADGAISPAMLEMGGDERTLGFMATSLLLYEPELQ